MYHPDRGYHREKQHHSDYGRDSRHRSDYGRNSQHRSDYGRNSQHRSDYGRNSQHRSDYGRNSQHRSDYGRDSHHRSDYERSSQHHSGYGRNSQSHSHQSHHKKRDEFGAKLRPRIYDMTKMWKIQKNVYDEHPDVMNRSEEDVKKFMKDEKLMTKGMNVPKPITNFSEGNFAGYVDEALKEMNFEKPTPIQSQAWPIALSGRDMVAIAQTGSGKTLAYVLPGIIHIAHQTPSLEHFDGPTMLVLAPTRELAQQIEAVCEKFCNSANMKSTCVFGGAEKCHQLYAMAKGVQIIIATPGRLIEYLEEQNVGLKNCSLLVLDEADRMLDMGFEPQIRKIIEQIRPDRQVLMFSATWPKEIICLAKEFLNDFVQVNVGSMELTANHNITQLVEYVDESEKFDRLLELVTNISLENENKTIIFAETKLRVDQIKDLLTRKGFCISSLHGNKSQSERNRVLSAFRDGRVPFLVATDVAARGLDVEDIKCVINVDFPNTTEDYVHRIGRTARSDKTGTAYTFFTYENAKLAGDLFDVLHEAKQPICPRLKELADMQKLGFLSSKGRGRKRTLSDDEYTTSTKEIQEANIEYRDCKEKKVFMQSSKEPSLIKIPPKKATPINVSDNIMNHPYFLLSREMDKLSQSKKKTSKESKKKEAESQATSRNDSKKSPENYSKKSPENDSKKSPENDSKKSPENDSKKSPKNDSFDCIILD